eukprot:97666-Rhodomonas_salina.1
MMLWYMLCSVICAPYGAMTSASRAMKGATNGARVCATDAGMDARCTARIQLLETAFLVQSVLSAWLFAFDFDL